MVNVVQHTDGQMGAILLYSTVTISTTMGRSAKGRNSSESNDCKWHHHANAMDILDTWRDTQFVSLFFDTTNYIWLMRLYYVRGYQ